MPGSVPSEEMVEPPFVKEAEVLVKAILAIAANRGLAALPKQLSKKEDACVRRRLLEAGPPHVEGSEEALPGGVEARSYNRVGATRFRFA